MRYSIPDYEALFAQILDGMERPIRTCAQRGWPQSRNCRLAGGCPTCLINAVSASFAANAHHNNHAPSEGAQMSKFRIPNQPKLDAYAAHQLALDAQMISDSRQWQQYVKRNPRARLCFHLRDDGRLGFALLNPISKGYEEVFEDASAVVRFAADRIEDHIWLM